nr:zinc knuckle CX2CX4HX4C [Tanacetum cinerariifolium]GFA44802.1 zinc knuckle CX2CX4HX4C [Tanacetum cinerariifolium]
MTGLLTDRVALDKYMGVWLRFKVSEPVEVRSMGLSKKVSSRYSSISLYPYQRSKSDGGPYFKSFANSGPTSGLGLTDDPKGGIFPFEGPSLISSLESPCKIPVWIRLPNVPLEAWNVKGISAISRLGFARGSGRLGFARVLVEINAEKPFLDSVEISYLRYSYGMMETLQKSKLELLGI